MQGWGGTLPEVPGVAMPKKPFQLKYNIHLSPIPPAPSGLAEIFLIRTIPPSLLSLSQNG